MMVTWTRSPGATRARCAARARRARTRDGRHTAYYTTIAHRTEYTDVRPRPFVEALLAELDAVGSPPDDRWVWSYHNYSDFERDYKHVVYLRQLLADTRMGRARGSTGAPSCGAPRAACGLTAMDSRFRWRSPPPRGRAPESQARVLTEALSRHHYAKGAGAGVGMLTQYTTYADRFNSGVLERRNGDPATVVGGLVTIPEYVPRPFSAPPGDRSPSPPGARPPVRGVSGCRAWRRRG